MASKAEQVRRNINAAFKSDVLSMASDSKYVVEYMPTNLLPFDMLMGGGIPKGRFVVLVGDWSTLKSYAGLCAIAAEQARGGVCALIDTEHSFDPAWATSIGVNVAELITPDKKQAQSGEQAIDYAEALIRENVDLIVFDSVAAALPQSERGKRMHDESVQPGRLAALMSLACRKLTAANSGTGIVWINQMRQSIGITFGNPEHPTGGKALPYYASLVIETRKSTKITRNVKTFNGSGNVDVKELLAQQYRATITKSKLNKPHREVVFDWNLEQGGIDIAKFLFAQGIENGLVVKKGNSYSMKNSQSKILGREKFIAWLAGSETAMGTLDSQIREIHGLEPISPGLPVAADRKKVVTRSVSRPNGVGRKSTRTAVPETSRVMRVLQKRS